MKKLSRRPASKRTACDELMKAVFYTGGKKPWAAAMGNRPWALLPVGGRPLLSYWLELCVDLGISDVQIILGKDAEHIELFCGNGEQWGLTIDYSFIPPDDSPQDYLTRDPSRWNDGLFFLGDALFPRRLETFTTEGLKEKFAGCCVSNENGPAFFLSQNSADITAFIQDGQYAQSACKLPVSMGLDFILIRDVPHYYELNMAVVHGEMNRYLSSGYSSADGASIGYNVITPPSVSFTPPFAIGNDCRLGALCSIGAGTVISDHVLIDRQCELSECIILSNTYLGRNLEIKGKIVAGNRIIDPEDGSHIDIEDPWLVAPTRLRKSLRDAARSVVGRGIALLLILIQLAPFLILYGLIRAVRRGSFAKKQIWGMTGTRVSTSRFTPADVKPCLLLMMFYGASLDRFPQLFDVLAGKLWLCGQVPKENERGEYTLKHRYFPAVFTNLDAFADIDKQMDALYYAHTRSIIADLRILYHALFARFIEVEYPAPVRPFRD